MRRTTGEAAVGRIDRWLCSSSIRIDRACLLTDQSAYTDLVVDGDLDLVHIVIRVPA